ncbi:MAG: group II truncated hemoglobin [Caulobacteraceae bacterium]|nr:group II truncated hemoglobin [Caulobacteraceae bacterium]
MTASASEPTEKSPFEVVGGAPVVARFVGRFYDLMETDPAYAPLRALHAPDLGPMRESLTGFFTGWLGGPRDWFVQRPGMCMMSAHAPIPMNADTARQWTQAMARALADAGVDPEIAARMNEAFERMAEGMAATAAARRVARAAEVAPEGVSG